MVYILDIRFLILEFLLFLPEVQSFMGFTRLREVLVSTWCYWVARLDHTCVVCRLGCD